MYEYCSRMVQRLIHDVWQYKRTMQARRNYIKIKETKIRN